MQLEQMMRYQPRVAQERQTTYFVVGELESLSASALYSGDKPIIDKHGRGMMVPLKINEISIHDTYRIDSEGNVSDGHSTINLPKGGKVYMPHGLEKPSIKSGSG
jgi:hypothetical protein